MEKEPCTNFCGVLVSFHEVMKLRSFEFAVSNVISENTKKKKPFMKKKPFTECMMFLTIFQDVMHVNEHT